MNLRKLISGAVRGLRSRNRYLQFGAMVVIILLLLLLLTRWELILSDAEMLMLGIDGPPHPPEPNPAKEFLSGELR